MKLITTALLLLGFGTAMLAQKGEIYPSESPYNASFAELHYWSYQLPSADTALAKTIIAQELDLNPNDQLRVVHIAKSLTATHITFKQFHQGIEVIGGGAKVAISDKNILFRCIETLFNTNGNLGTPPADFKVEINLSDFNRVELLESKPAFIWTGEQIVAGWFTSFNHDERGFSEAGWNTSGDLIFLHDKLAYHAQVDTTVEVKVFDPDPMTPHGQVYGGFFIDDNDSNVAFLNALRKKRTINVSFENGLYRLKNDYVEIVEHDFPIYPVILSPEPIFFPSRDEYGFEQVNAYYHITKYQKYLQDLGYALVQYPIQVDAQGWGGQDNSSFNASGQPHPELSFGEGGVDDAEDADVVIHEYGHAISNSASPFTNSGLERRSLDEALGDYFAVSYNKDQYSFGSDKVYNWDGHNEFWPGRTVNNPQNVCYNNITSFSNIYQHTTVFNAAMFEIWSSLGKVYTDRLMIEATYGYFQNMTYRDAAFMVLDADSMLTGGGSNTYVIYQAFDNHCIINWSSVAENEKSGNAPYTIKQTKDVLAIQYYAGTADYQLLDINGRLVASGELLSGENQIAISHLPQAMYILKINSGTKAFAEKIVTVQ